MKYLLLTTIAAVVLVGCGESQQSAPVDETKPVDPVTEAPVQPSTPLVEAKPPEPVGEAIKPEPPTARPSYILIHQAAQRGDTESIKRHLDAGTDVDVRTKTLRWTPLHRAHKRAAKLLIAEGADVNAKNADGVTPLHRVARDGHKQTAELLIANGAGVNEKDENGETPLDRAIARKRIEIIDLLRKHGGKTGLWLRAGESIHIAAAAGHIEAVKHFLAAGGDVNAKDKNGWTGLHHAALAGRIEITQLLIAKGVDVNTRNDRRRTPLDYVVNNAVKTNNRDEIIELLRKNGGKTDEELKAEGK